MRTILIHIAAYIHLFDCMIPVLMVMVTIIISCDVHEKSCKLVMVSICLTDAEALRAFRGKTFCVGYLQETVGTRCVKLLTLITFSFLFFYLRILVTLT